MEEKKRTERSSIKGVVRRYNDESFEFTPFGKGEPVYEEQHKFKNGVTVGKTRGANGKRVVRIPVDADAPDIFAACTEKLGEAFPAAEERQPAARGTVLLEGSDLRMMLNKRGGTITYTGTINLAKSPNYNNQFVKQFNELNQCLAINRTSLQSVVNALLKSSNN